MEPEVEAAFTPQLREAAAEAFGATWAALDELGDFENYVYGFAHRGQPAVLRVTHCSHRSRAEIEAELAWLRYMCDGGVRFCAPLRSPAGRLVEVVGDEQFFVAAFERAPGRPVTQDELSEDVYAALGQILGRSHHLTRSYRSPPEAPGRPAWHEEGHVVAIPDRVPGDQELVHRRYREGLAGLHSLATGDDAFGIVHTDLHLQNFHWHDGTVLAFDTDDCAWHWFLEDISTVFYYSVRRADGAAAVDAFLERFFPPFWRAYQGEYELDPAWLDRLPLFMLFRTLTLYSLVQIKWPAATRTEEQGAAMTRMRRAIESEGPFLDFDFRAHA